MSEQTIVQEQHISELSDPPPVPISSISCDTNVELNRPIATNVTSSLMQAIGECTRDEQMEDTNTYADEKLRFQELSGSQDEQRYEVEEQIHGAACPSGQQESTHNAEEEFIQDLISSPDRIRRVTKQLQRLRFSNPGPQMRSHATDSRLRGRPQPSTVGESGCLVPKKADRCDCLDIECPGCFLPCPKCSSNKCGVVCRVGRSWNYVREIHRDRASDWQEW